jgi:predicted transcriptional regulator
LSAIIYLKFIGAYDLSMEEQALISHIEELGLSNKEARIYVACLAIGPSPVQRIADQSGIKRVTTYVILESLVGLGLVSQSVKGKKTYFIAEDPTNLRRLLDKREQELKEQKHNFDQVLPELQNLKLLPKESPTVKFYDSPDGIKTIMNLFLEQGKRPGVDIVYGFSNLDQLYAYFPEFRTASANPGRVRAGIKSHMLYTSSEGPILHVSDAERNRESRFLPYSVFPMSGDFTIVGDNVLMLSLSGPRPIGITISSKELSQGLRAMFMMAWEVAGTLGENRETTG